MSVNLCVDWGNTRVKAAIYDSEKQVENRNFSADEAASAIAALIDSHKPEKGIMCAVTNHTSEAEHLMSDKLKAFLKLNNNGENYAQQVQSKGPEMRIKSTETRNFNQKNPINRFREQKN